MKFQHFKMPMVVNFDIIEPIPKASINNIISRFDIPRFIPKRIPYNNNCFNVLDEVALKDQYLFNKSLRQNQVSLLLNLTIHTISLLNC